MISRKQQLLMRMEYKKAPHGSAARVSFVYRRDIAKDVFGTDDPKRLKNEVMLTGMLQSETRSGLKRKDIMNTVSMRMTLFVYMETALRIRG